MKLRIGFITNSSSSSFTIARSDLTDEQIEKIKNYFEAAKEVGMNDFDDLWDIDETNFGIRGFTCMDNDATVGDRCRAIVDQRWPCASCAGRAREVAGTSRNSHAARATGKGLGKAGLTKHHPLSIIP